MTLFVGAALLFVLLMFTLLWDKPVLLIYFVILMTLTMDMFGIVFGVFARLSNPVAAIGCYLLLVAIVKNTCFVKRPHLVLQCMIIVGLIAVSVISVVVNGVGFKVAGIGMFQLLRNFAFFLACTEFLDLREIRRIFALLVGFSVFNVLVAFIEHKKYGAKGDFNGGIFGMTVGCNGKLNLFLVTVTVIVMVFYLANKMSTIMASVFLVCCLVSATVSEIKIYYFEFAAILIMTVLLSRFSRKTLILTVVALVSMVVGIWILGQMFPLFKDFFSVDSIVEYGTGDYGNSEGSINRLTGLSSMFGYLQTPLQKIFGLGIGNAHVGTPFYEAHSYLKYIWLYDAYLFTELGISGLGLYYMFFVSIAVAAFWMRRKFTNPELGPYFTVAIELAALSVVFSAQDASMITSSALIIFMVMAIPFAIFRNKSEIPVAA